MGGIRRIVPRAAPGGLFVGGGWTQRGQGGIPGQRGVGEVLLAAPREAWQKVWCLSRGRRGFRKVKAENRPRGRRALAAAVQEQQQEGQKEQDGGREEDAQERLCVFSAGARPLGALQAEDRRKLGAGEGLVSLTSLFSTPTPLPVCSLEKLL